MHDSPQPTGDNNWTLVRDETGAAAASVYSLAFQDDPIVARCLKLDDEVLDGFFEPLIALSHGSHPAASSYVIETGGLPVAAATLLPPEWKPDDRMQDRAMTQLRQRLGILAMTRIYRLLHASSKLDRPKTRAAHLLFIGTLPEHRRRGYAAHLLNAIDGAAIETGAESVYLEVATCSRAVELYKKHGYAEFGRAKLLGEGVLVLENRLKF